MRDANLLVVIDTNTANCPFILSKSIDYAGSGTPIVGIMPADNPTAEFITELGFQSFTYDQVQELASYIERVIDGGVPLLPNPSVVQAHYVQNTTARLLGLCQEVWAESVASSSIDQV
jgi:hypothetical protein